MNANDPRHPTHNYQLRPNGTPIRQSSTGMWLCEKCRAPFYSDASIAPCPKAEQDRVWDAVRQASKGSSHA